MRSIGVDNIGLALNISQSEWRALQQECHFKNPKTGAYAFIPDQIYFVPKGSFILMNINVPKLAFGHNILLAQPKDVETAIKKCESLLPLSLSLLNTEVRSVHFTYTQDTSFPYQLWREHITAPKRGTWKLEEEENGIYCNNANQCERVLFYGKDGQLRAKGKTIPLSVANQCNYEYIIRLEQRLDRAVRKQLKIRGLWTSPYLLCSDLLTSEGFLAFVKFFEWRALQCIISLSEKKVRPLSFMEKAMLSVPVESAKFYKKRLSETDYLGILSEIEKFEKKERPKVLIKGIRAECKKTYECYNNRLPIAGNIYAEELIYARS